MTSEADFQAVLDRIDSLMREMDGKLKLADSAYHEGLRALDAAAEVLGPMVNPLRSSLINAKRQLDNTTSRLTTSVHTVRVAAGPVMTMMAYDDAWLEIRNLANTVASNLERPQDRLDRFWEGPAATKYFSIVDPQVNAARRMAFLAEKASTTLQDMALQGVAFYVAIAAALVTAIGGIIATVVGFGTVVGTPVGVAGIVVVAAAAVAIAGAATNFMLQTDKAGTILLGEATNIAGFSKGPSWPKAVALSTDVTAADQDEADWKARNP